LLGDSSTTFSTRTYEADALDEKLTALGRLGYVSRCVSDQSTNVVEWAICQPDIDALDLGKAGAEIDADQAHASDHAPLKAWIDVVKGKLAVHKAAAQAALGKDDAYKKMFELAAASRRDARSSPLRDLALTLDDARVTQSRKALAGCEDKVWPAWLRAVSAIPAQRFSLVYKDLPTEVFVGEAATIVGTPDGYLAGVAVAACLKKDQLVSYLQHALVFWPGYRGPRNASQLAMMQAGLQLDQVGATIRWPSIDRRALLAGASNGGNDGANRSGRAPLVSLQSAGEKTHVTFGPTKTKGVKCVDYKAGKHLSRIESDGRLVYEGTCYKYTDIVITNPPPAPADAPSRYTASMKPGMYGGYVDNVVLDAIAGLGAKAPSVVFGAPVR